MDTAPRPGMLPGQGAVARHGNGPANIPPFGP